MASYSDYDKSGPRCEYSVQTCLVITDAIFVVITAYQVVLPRQETGYDKTKEEFCNVVIDSFSFIKRLPAASSFLLVLSTLVSITSSYLGIELVLNRKIKKGG